MRTFNNLFTVKNCLFCILYVIVGAFGLGYIKECIRVEIYPFTFWIVLVQTLTCFTAFVNLFFIMTNNDKRFDKK